MEERNLILEEIEKNKDNINKLNQQTIKVKYISIEKLKKDLVEISDDKIYFIKNNFILELYCNDNLFIEKYISINLSNFTKKISNLNLINFNIINYYIWFENINNINLNIDIDFITGKYIYIQNCNLNKIFFRSKTKKTWGIIISDNCKINTIQILEYISNYDQENISIFNSKIDELIIEKSNFKDLVINNSIINNIKIKDNNILNFNLLNFHNNLYINNNICNCNFLLENSNLSEKNVKIFNLNIENFKIENSNLWKSIISNTKIKNLELKNPVLNETIFNNVEFPKTDIKIAWEENSTNYSEIKEYYIQLKNVMDNSWNHIQADKFFAKEMEYYGKSLKWEKWQFWNKLVYYIQKWISDFWNDWTLPILWIINLWNLFLIIDYYLKDYKLISDVNFILYLKNLYRYLNDLANAIKPLDVLNVTSDITFFWLLYKITLAILIYHLIISLKRLTKR